MVYSALKGRIGNNLFQIAAGLTLAKNNNTGFAVCVPKIMLPAPDNCLLNEYLNQFRGNILRNLDLIDYIPENIFSYEETGLSYSPIKYYPEILLNGYFQSEKYFDNKLVRETFSIDNQNFSYINSKYGDILSQEITSINVRRGDFVAIPQYHPVCSMIYFRKAINYVGREKRFLIISDDIDWCKKKFKGENFYFVDDENPVIDLYLQTLCTNNIISNSSFSWWGAWLNSNPDKLVISPSENWVGKLHQLSDTKDILPEDWIKLANPLSFRSRIILICSTIVKFLVIAKKRLIRSSNKKN